MKAGGADSTIRLVIVFQPVIDLLDILEVVDIVGRWGAIGSKPDKLGWVQNGRNDQLILGMGMPDILLVNGLLEVDEPLHYGVPRGPPQQVVEPSRHKDPHGPGLLLVVHSEGMGQVWDSPTGNSYPINMERVWGTGDRGVPGLVEVVELACPQAHIEPNVRVGGVHGHAGGAHVVGVAVGVLHTLHDADLSW